MVDKPLFDDNWISSVGDTKDTWVSDVLENINGTGGIYLKCISSWFNELSGSNKQKNHLKTSLKSSNNSDHLGAVNELSWWKFLKSLNYDLKPIATGKLKTPDFILELKNSNVFFEVTTLNPVKNPNSSDINNSQKSSLYRIVAKAYGDKKEQFVYGHSKQCPSVLVLFNYDDWTGFGTQFHSQLNNSTLFSNTLSELSAIIYVERYVIDGKPHFKKDSFVVIDNPEAHFLLPPDIKKRMSSARSHNNWIRL